MRSPAPHHVQAILVIRLTSLGDVVLTEPVLRALRRRFPSARVDLLTEARYAPLMAATSGADAVIPWDRHGGDRGLGGITRVALRLPVPRYDLVIDLQAKLRTRALSSRIDHQERITLKKRTALGALLSVVGHDPPIDDVHTVDLYLKTIAPLGATLAPDEARPILERPAVARAADRPRIGLGIGTTHATKRWAPERFAELADRLPGASFVLIGGKEDRADLDLVRAKVTRARIDPADLTALDVMGLARAIADLDLLVGVDSGPAHLAAAFGVPVVVLFGPTSAVRWGPRGAGNAAITLGLECAPCSNVGGPECPIPAKGHACMRDLDVARVLAAATTALEGRGVRW